MLRQASSRNHRSKGFKVKHVLQICLLVAVCIWLIYQVKHSHDKKRAFEERNSKVVDKEDDIQPAILKFGRKDLPHIVETDSVSETRKEEEEEEEDENEKIEEATQETKQEEMEDEDGRGAGDDEIDEHDQERDDEEAERGEEFLTEEDKDDQGGESDLLDNQDHEATLQGAREETYKRDDASSAMARDTQTIESESGNGDSRSSDEQQMENMEKKDLENQANGTVGGSNGNVSGDVRTADGSEGNNSSVIGAMDSSTGNDSSVVETMDSSKGNDSSVVLGETEPKPNNNPSMNETAVVEGESEVVSSKLEDGSRSNSTSVESINQVELQSNSITETLPNDPMEAQSNPTTIDAVTNNVPQQNETISLDSVQDQNATDENGNPQEHISTLENAVEQTEKSTTTVELEESKDSSNTSTVTNENSDTVQGESNESSTNLVTEEERDARTDLSTLPDIQTEVKNIEDVAAE